MVDNQMKKNKHWQYLAQEHNYRPLNDGMNTILNDIGNSPLLFH